MSDLRTIVKDLLQVLKIDDAPSGSKAEIDAKVAVFKAIRHNRKYRLGFNERWGTITGMLNKERYKLPSDYVGIVQDYVFSTPSNQFLYKRKLKSLPLAHLNLIMQSGIINPAYRETGPPTAYSIDMATKEIVIFPTASVDGDIIEFLYLSDLGNPEFVYDGTNWQFYIKGTTTSIAADWTNEWLDEGLGYDLTFARAMYNLLNGPYKSAETAQDRADWLNTWAESLNTLRSEANKARAVVEIRRHIT